MLDLEPAAHEVARLLEGVRDDQLPDPTPCEGLPVAAVLDHLLGLCLAFTWAAHKTAPPDGPGPAPGTSRPEDLDQDWRALLPARLDDLVEAWRRPDAWSGMAQAGGVTMPGAVMGIVALDELALHGWDLAKATGQEFNVDDASAQAVLAFTTESALPENAGSRDGLFGAVVPVAADAPVFERALGLAGRDPRWAPPVSLVEA